MMSRVSGFFIMKKATIRIACGQINCTVGDMAGNSRKIRDFAALAREAGADIVLFPELALTGYPPEDLLLKPAFIRDNLKEMEHLSGAVSGIAALVGFVDQKAGCLYNAVALVCAGKIRAVYHKMCLPNYGVFDEKRYFKNGDKPLVFGYGGCAFGVSVCEDIWDAAAGPVAAAVKGGSRCILSINASPYHAGKGGEREALIIGQARKHNVPIVYVNLVGGQDELVFDGQSLVVDPAAARRLKRIFWSLTWRSRDTRASRHGWFRPAISPARGNIRFRQAR